MTVPGTEQMKLCRPPKRIIETVERREAVLPSYTTSGIHHYDCFIIIITWLYILSSFCLAESRTEEEAIGCNDNRHHRQSFGNDFLIRSCGVQNFCSFDTVNVALADIHNLTILE